MCVNCKLERMKEETVIIFSLPLETVSVTVGHRHLASYLEVRRQAAAAITWYATFFNSIFLNYMRGSMEWVNS